MRMYSLGVLLNHLIYRRFFTKGGREFLVDEHSHVEADYNRHRADDIDGLAGEEEELANLVERFDKASRAYGMEISAEKTKMMTNNTSGMNTEIKVNGQKLETATSFKYLGSVITDEGSKPELLCRIAQATAALTRLKPI